MKTFAVVLIAALSFTAAAAQDCIYYEDYLHWVGTQHWSDEDDATEVAVSGSYALATDNTLGLRVLDISGPGAPEVVGYLHFPGGAWGVAGSGDYVYVTADGFHVVDISDLPNLEIVGFVATQDGRLAVEGSFAYITGDGLQVVDISDPTSPQIVGNIDTLGNSTDVAIADSYAYIATESGLHVIDISNPASPQLIGSEVVPYWAESVAVSGDYAYVTWPNGFAIVDITDPAHPQTVGGAEMITYIHDVDVLGDYAYAACSEGPDSGLRVFNVTDPEDVQCVGRFSAQYCYRVAVSPSRVFVLERSPYPEPGSCSGVHALDITNPESPSHVGATDGLSQYCRNVAVAENTAYVVALSEGLQVIDISDPANPQVIATVDTQSSANDIVVSGHVAYVSSNFGLHIIDISDPENCQITGEVETVGEAQSLTVSGSYVYLYVDLQDEDAILVIDVSDPEDPQIVNSITLSNVGYTAYVADSECRLYVTTWNRLYVFDIADPNRIHILGDVETMFGWGLAVSGDYAYVACSEYLRVIDVADPTNPQTVGRIATPLYGQGVAVYGQYAYMTTYDLLVIDIGDPTNPSAAGNLGSIARGRPVVQGELVYLAGSDGLKIVPAQCNDAVAVEADPEELWPDEQVWKTGLAVAVHPNPFNPQTTISFAVDRPQHAEVAVYDLTGQLLGVLANRSYDVGSHSVVWNGKDATGRAMPSGTYVVRLESESGVEARKVMLIR